MAKVARQAHTVVWANPLKGRPGYLPLAGGMRAALPYVDRFVSGHDVESVELLAALLGGIGRRHEKANTEAHAHKNTEADVEISSDRRPDTG
jgi:hypothetical protein